MTEPPAPRPRVAIFASGIDATDVGEVWSSFQWVSRLSRSCDTTALCYHQRGHPAASAQLPDTRVVEWPDWPFVGRFRRFNQMLKPGYLGFHRRARRWLRAALARGERFDLLHQLSPLAPRYPSPGVGLGVPLIVGPVGGSLPTPPAFAHELGGTPWFARVRALDGWRLAHDPWLRRSYEQAAVVIGVAPYVRSVFGRLAIRRFEVMSETGVVALPELPEERSRRTRCERLLFVGRLVRTKGARDAVRALARVRDLAPLELEVVGEGDDRAACEAEARALGVADRVHFHGRLPRAEVDRFYARADAFVFPSFREPSGNVVMEALSWGLPVLTADAGGPGYVVDARCGAKVPVGDPEQYADALAGALRRWVEDPLAFRSLARGARERAAEIALWDSKVAWMRALYASVLGSVARR